MSVDKWINSFGGISPNKDGDRYKPGEDAVESYEGGAVYKKNLHEKIKDVVMLGLISGKFYENENEVLTRTKAIWEEAIAKCKTDPEFADYIMRLLAYGRNQGGMKFQPVLGLVYLSTLDDKSYFKKAFFDVIKTPKDAHDFITLCRKSGIREGVGRCIKTIFNQYFGKLSVYHARRYTGKLREIARVVRPKTKENEVHKNKILSYIVKDEKTYEDFAALAEAVNRLNENIVDDVTLKLISNYKLQLEEIKYAFGNLSKENLRKVYTHMIPGLSIMALMQNLETIAWVFSEGKRPSFKEKQKRDYYILSYNYIPGIKEEIVNPIYRPDCKHLTPNIIEMVEKKLRDVEAYRRSRMLPFTPLMAAKMTSVPDWRDALVDMVTELTTTMFDPEILKNLKIRINVDTSGSMQETRLTNNNNHCSRYENRGPAIYANELSGILGSAIYRNASEGSSIWAVATDYEKIPVKTLKPFKLAQEIMETDVGFGTHFEQCMKNYNNEDIYILITDSVPADNLEKAWAKTKRKPGSKLIIWHIVDYPFKISNRPDVFSFSGYSDKQMEVIRAIIEDKGDQIELIKNYNLSCETGV